MKQRELLNQIDATLDQLIENDATLKEIGNDSLYEVEKEALLKMQESLLARLVHLDTFIEKKGGSKTLDKKRSLVTKFSLSRRLPSRRQHKTCINNISL